MAKKEKKPELLSMIEEKLNNAEIVISTDYRGLTVSEISELRGKLRQEGIEYHVVKNTLATLAAKSAGKPDISELLKGPTALAFGYDDAVEPAKVLLDYQRANKDTHLSIKGGMLAEKLLSATDVTALAKLPPKDELIAKFVGLAQSPISRLLNVLNGNLQGLVTVLQARTKQLEEGG